MGCRRSVLLVLIARSTLLFIFLFSLFLLTSPYVMAVGDERTPVRGKHGPFPMDQQGGVAGAAKVASERLAAAFPRVEGLVIGLEGDLILIDRGTAEGVVQGMELDVFREGGEFKHPLTGEVLGRLDKDLGRIRVLHVRERYAEATVIKKVEKAGFRKGDRVRVSMARMIVAFPNVDVEGVSGISARSITKDLAAALVRTGRFELVEDRQLRSILSAERELRAPELADPKILKQLADRGNIQILLLSRLAPSADGISLDVQAYATLTGNPIILASAMVQSRAATDDKSSRGPEPARAVPSTAARPTETGKSTVVASPKVNSLPVVSMPSGHVVLEPALDGSMTAMAVTDLDGDGKSELLVAGPNRLLAFRFDGTRLRSLAEYPLSGKDQVVGLEALDVTGDAGAEVIMTLSHKNRVRAFVLQWADGMLRPISEIRDVVLRPLSPISNTVQLFGQTVMPGERITHPIHRYTWDGRNFQAGSALDVPSGLSLLEFTMADLNGDGVVRLLTFQRGGTLEVGSQTGKLIARYKVAEGARALANQVDPRILIEKDRDGEKPLVIVARVRKVESRLLPSWSEDKTGGLAVLKWEGTQFHEVLQTPITDGVLADYAVADLGGELGRRLLALIVRSGRLGWGTKSEIQAFRIR